MLKNISFIVCFVCLLGSLSAQVVNIEKKRKKDKESGIQGNFDLSFNLIQASSEIIQAKNNIKLQYYKKKHTALFFNDISLSQIDGNKYLNDGFQHFRYNYDLIGNAVIAEAFVQHQYNTIKKLEKRFLFGAGPRFKLADTDTFRLFVGPLSMFEYELLDNDSITRKYRMSFYVSLSYSFNELLNFNHISYYQPNYNDFSDFRLSGESSLNIKVTDKLALKVSFNIAYDATPPPGVNDLFYTWLNGLSYSF